MRLECRALRTGEVAMLRPSGAEGQKGEMALVAPEEGEPPHGEAGRGAVEPRSLGEEGPKGNAVTLRRWREMALEFTLAPVTHHSGQRDLHRADGLAASAKGRGVRQIAALPDPDERRREHGPHRPGIDPAISMAADGVIDGAVIHAGAAANAAQHILELRAEHRRAAIVEDHDMVFAGAIRISSAARP